MSRFAALSAPCLMVCSLLFATSGVVGQAAAPAQPAEDEQELTFVADLWTPPEQCPEDAVSEVALEEIARHPERFMGKCVRTSGLWIGRALYSDIEGYYRTESRTSNAPKALRPYRIGLYGREKVVNAPDDEGSSSAKVTGKVGSCETVASGWVMVMGYCHYTNGPYIALASATLERAKLTRLTGENARRRFGNLEPLAETGPDRIIIEPLAARWMRDIQGGDIADFAALHAIRTSEIDLDDEHGLLHAVFNAPNSSFAAFRRRTDAPAPVFFRVRPVKEGDQDSPQEQSDQSAGFVACFCRRASCDDLWPITSFDAENASSRPYVCLGIDRERDRGEWRETVRTELDWRTFVDEPAAATRH